MEMAVFGSLILLVFAVLVSYIQRYNDQQYVQMEAFRRALEKAETYSTGSGENNNPGASVQFTLMNNRRYADPEGSYGKGSAQSVSASSSVYWAVPYVGKTAASQVWYKVNDDELTIDENTTIDKIVTTSTVNFNETIAKSETPSAIVNHDISRLQDTITTTAVASNGTGFSITQGLYVDGGQYHYSQGAVGQRVEREKTWTTPF